MGPESLERNLGRSSPTRTVYEAARRASSGLLYDDRSVSLSPPSIRPVFSVSPVHQLEDKGHLTEEEQSLVQQPGRPNSAGDTYLTENETRANCLRPRDQRIEPVRFGDREGQNMGRFSRDNDEPSEATALLIGGSTLDSQGTYRTVSIPKDRDEIGDKTRDEVETNEKKEFLVLTKYALPLMITCVLQYSLSAASVIAVGHLGKTELGAVSLASMTSNVTGYCAYAGLATSLDTLCAQAYGSGRPHLVGLHVQRMVYFLWIITIPIAAVWFGGTQILLSITPDRECAELAGLFLKVLILGAPGFAMFEAGKRFVQAQGLFNANLYVLLLCAPLNAFMNWLFVWKFNWGFIGAPIAVAVTNNLLPLCLCLYVYFVDGMGCWNGFTRQALHNWYPMIRLAVPGFVMVFSEFLAFEILTLASSHLCTTALAAQSILSTLSFITFQIPFPVSIAASTRLANLIGAGMPGASQVCIKVTLAMACGAGAVNVVVLTTLRNYVPEIFTSDGAVADLVVEVIPLFAAFQLFDALVANCGGILRGTGRQNIGGWVNVVCYYGFAIPASLGITFGLRWGLFGLWIGPAVGLFLISAIETWFIYRLDWTKIIEAAILRNESEAC